MNSQPFNKKVFIQIVYDNYIRLGKLGKEEKEEFRIGMTHINNGINKIYKRDDIDTIMEDIEDVEDTFVEYTDTKNVYLCLVFEVVKYIDTNAPTNVPTYFSHISKFYKKCVDILSDNVIYT